MLSKAKRKDTKEWVTGYYFCMDHPDKRHSHHFIIPIGADLSLGTPIEKIQVEIDVKTLHRYNKSSSTKELVNPGVKIYGTNCNNLSYADGWNDCLKEMGLLK